MRQKNSIKKQCLSCGKEFGVHKFREDTAKFCSRKCKVDYQQKDYKYVPCTQCGKSVTVNWYKKKATKYFCSSECYQKYRAKILVTCAGCGVKFMAHQSRQSYYNQLYCSKDCYLTNGAIGTVGFIHNEHYDTVRIKLTKTAEYLKWKHDVLERDHYTCVQCGSQENLRVHHILEFYHIVYKYNPRLLLDNLKDILSSPEFNDVSNGKTLCNSCHIKEHHLVPLSGNR